MTFEPGTALEFFAGIGLARMGLEKAGWRVVFANDYDPKKQEMHESHWGPDANYKLKSVFAVDSAEVPSAELAWASFPCVDLSLAGNRAGLSGKDSSAFWGFADVLSRLHSEGRCPPIVIIENVVGMLTSHGGRDLETILGFLDGMGFSLDMLEIDAAYFVPQSRARIFILATRGPYELPPRSLLFPSPFRPKRIGAYIESHPGLRWGTAPVGKPPERTSTLADIVEHFPADADIWWPSHAVEKLTSQMSPRHLAAVNSLTDRDSIAVGTVYRRVRSTGCMAEVRLDGLAGCLRTPRGGSSKQFVLEMGRGELRARHMTAIEYGRLQGADDFRVRVPFNQALFGFGDAVCVPAVEWLLRNAVEPLRTARVTAANA